jgi:hypothetical protein
LTSGRCASTALFCKPNRRWINRIRDAREKNHVHDFPNNRFKDSCDHRCINNSNQVKKIAMLMKTKFALFPALAGFALVAAGLCRGGNEQLDTAANTPVERLEKGPATIDVSKYPAGIQENYKVFSRKCSQCHNLGRPINSDYVLPDEWSRCIGRMKHRSSSDISSSEERKLYDFLVFDSSIRKRAKLEMKLQTLTPDAQRKVEDKIKEVADKYQ